MADQISMFGGSMAEPKKMNEKIYANDLGGGIWEVKSFTDPSKKYQVDMNEKSCTCEDFIYKIPKIAGYECKHIMAVKNPAKPVADKGEYKSLTKNGYDTGEVVSALQKAIRRGDEKMAVWWARELVELGWWNYLFRRLRVIAGEDIGHANPEAMILVNTTYLALLAEADLAKKGGKGWWKPDNNIYQFVVGYMARSPKSRHVDYLGGVIYKKAEMGARPEIPAEAIDQHTKRGRDMGMGDDEFFRDGARIMNKKHIEGEDEIKKECLDLYGFKEERDEDQF